MEKDNRIANPDKNALRNKRVKRIKKWIIIIAVALLLLPTILCIIMFIKMNSLQKQIDVLMIKKYGTTYNSMNSVNHNIAHAATKDEMKNSLEFPTIEDYLNETQEDFTSSLEEISKNEYNKDGVQDNTNTAANEAEKNAQTAKNGQAVNNKQITTDAETISAANASNNIQTTNNINSGTAGNETDNTHTKNNDKSTEQESKDKKNTKAGAAKNGKSSADISKPDEKKEFSNKKVYITFDDGPSKYTDDILKLLDKYQVKATFFVIGKTDDYSKKMYKKIVEEGHSLGMHSYSHDYNIIYKSLEDFDKDFTRIRDLLYDTTGYLSNIYRFPGGSSNEVCKEDISVFINYLNKKSVVYFDWNVASGDATGIDYTVQELYDNVINGIKLHDRSIVLMHDTDAKTNTVKSLDKILKTLTEEGASILPLDDSVTPIQQVKSKTSNKKNK